MLNCNYAFKIKLMHSFGKPFEPSFTYNYHNLVVACVKELLCKRANECVENVTRRYDTEGWNGARPFRHGDKHVRARFPQLDILNVRCRILLPTPFYAQKRSYVPAELRPGTSLRFSGAPRGFVTAEPCLEGVHEEV